MEDDATAAFLLESIVAGMGHVPRRAASGIEAQEMADAEEFDLVMLDLGLPDIDGIEVARRLRRRHPAERLPIVFVSGDHDPEARVQGFAVGGADFVTKPYHVPEVRARVRHQLETRRLRRELETAAEVLERRVEDRTVELSRRMGELKTEVELRRRLEEDLRHLAETDPVTELLNQRGLPRRLDQWLADTPSSLVVAVEVDGWESISGVLGHRDADRLLCALADRIRSGDGGGPAGRLGASFFVTSLVSSQVDLAAQVDAFRRSLERPIRVDGRSLRLTYSIGVVENPSATPASDLLRDATLALHAAKQQPGTTVVLDAAQRLALADELVLEQELWGAAERDELILEYQPVFDTFTLRPAGFEALVRWRHPQRGLVSPAQFIPLAERSGAIGEIGTWTLDEATRQLGDWRRRGVVGADVGIAVNVSAVEVVDLGLPARVLAALHRAGLGPDALDLELTETAVLRPDPVVRRVLGELNDSGICLCLDDFGTGNSSLTILQQTPAHVVKIDRSFVSRLLEDPYSRAIVESTIGLAHRLGKRVIGEGVETRAQLQMLRELGCDQVQGYLLSPPAGAVETARLDQADVDRRAGTAVPGARMSPAGTR